MAQLPREELKFIRKISGFANLGVMASPEVIEKVLVQLIYIEQEDAKFEVTRQLLHALQTRVLPSQMECQKSMSEIDKLLIKN